MINVRIIPLKHGHVDNTNIRSSIIYILILIITGNADSPGRVSWGRVGYRDKMGKIHDNARKLL